MRHLQAGLVDHVISRQDEIQIQRSRSTGVGTFPAELPLDLEERREQRARVERGRSDHDGVQIQRLILESLPLRYGLHEIRDGWLSQERIETLDREGERGAAVPQVAAERDRNPTVGHGSLAYSTQRVDSTPPPVPAPSARRPRRSLRPASACSKNRLCSSVSPMMTFSMLRWRAWVMADRRGRHLSTNACAASRSA